MTLQEKLESLEQQIEELRTQLKYVNTNADSTFQKPVAYVGNTRIVGMNRTIDTKAGKGALFGGPIVWNDTEARCPINEEPSEPSVGYAKHTHSRFSGGAILADYMEIVQYDWGSVSIENKHSQGFWQNNPTIKKAETSSGQAVDMIGKVSFAFDADSRTWGCAAYEIDIEKCYLVQYDVDNDGNRTVKVDSKGQEMRSLLYDKKDPTKCSVLWDENGACWRLLAVYAPEQEENA